MNRIITTKPSRSQMLARAALALVLAVLAATTAGAVDLTGWGYNVVGEKFPDALDGTKGTLSDGAGHTIPFVVHNFEQATGVGTDNVTVTPRGSVFIDPEDYANKPAGTYTGSVNGIALSLTISTPVVPIVVTSANVNDIFCGDNPTEGDVFSQNCLGPQISAGAILDFQGEINKNRSLVINKKVGIFSSTKDTEINLHTVTGDSENGIPKFSFIVSTGASGSVIKDLFIHNCQTWIYNVADVLLKDITISVSSINIGANEGTGQTAIRYCDNITIDGCTIFTNNTSNAPSVVFYVTNRSTIINTAIEGQGQTGSLLALICPNEVYDDETPFASYVATNTGNTIKDCEFKTGNNNAFPIEIEGEKVNNTTIDGIQVYASKNIKTGANATVKNSAFYGASGFDLHANSTAYNNVVHGSSTISSGSTVYNNTFEDITISDTDITFENNTVTNKLTVSKPNTITNNCLGGVSIGNNGYSLSNNIEKTTTLTNNTIRGKVTVDAKKATISNNTIVTTDEYGVDVQNTGVIVKDNIIVSGNRNGNDAVLTNQTDTELSSNIGGTPLTATTATLEAADGISRTYIVPANTTVSIDGGLTVAPVDGATSPKTSIILYEGAKLILEGGVAASGVQIDIVGPGALHCGDIACKELAVNSGKITAGNITATDKITLNLTTWTDNIYATGYSAPTVTTTAASSDLSLFDETGLTDIVAFQDVNATTIAGKTVCMAGYCGISIVNGGRNLVWHLTDADDGTPAVEIERNIKAVNAGQTDYRMPSYGATGPSWTVYNPTVVYLGTGITNVESDAFKKNDIKLLLTRTEADYAACYAAATSGNGNGWYQEVNGRTYLSMLAPRSLTVTKNASGWATFCHNYPRKFKLSEGTIYTITGLSSDGKSVTTEALDDNLAAPGAPLLLNFSGTGTLTLTPDPEEPATAAADDLLTTTSTGWTFYGNASYEDITAADATFIKVNDSDNASYVLRGGEFVRVDRNEGLAAHRCLINVDWAVVKAGQTNNAPARLAIGQDGSETGIDAVDNGQWIMDNYPTQWYDLQGRKLSKLPTKKGIYVNGGRKVVIK